MEEPQNKENILNIALKLFAEKGYDAVGIAEICQATGITKPTLYYYYKSKLGLLQAIIEAKGNKLVEETKAALDYQHDFIKSLTLVLKAVLSYAEQEKDFFRLHITMLNSPVNSEASVAYNDVKTELESLYKEFFVNSATEFGNMRGKEELYSILFANNVNQCGLNLINNAVEFDEEVIYRIIHSFVYGVAN